jgi:hypothetical protein
MLRYSRADLQPSLTSKLASEVLWSSKFPGGDDWLLLLKETGDVSRKPVKLLELGADMVCKMTRRRRAGVKGGGLLQGVRSLFVLKFYKVKYKYM